MDRNGWIRFSLLLLLALLLRLFFFTGTVGGDDIVYSRVASRYLDGTCHFFNVHETRVGFLFPIVFSYGLFGVGEVPLVLYNLTCGLGLIVVAFLLGRRLFEENAGFAAMALVAFHPTLIYYSTECHTDLCVAFWQGLAVWTFLKASEENRSVGWMMLAGLLVGMAYLHKITALFILPLFAFHWWRARRSWKFYLPAGLAALAVFLGETAMYSLTTGNPMERLSQIEIWHQQYMIDQYPDTDALLYRFFLDLPVKLFAPSPVYHGQGVPHLIGLFAGLAILVRRLPGRKWVWVWFLGLYFFISFWPSSFRPLLPGYTLYGWTFPIFCLPFALMTAGMLSRWRRHARLGVLLILGIFCVHAINVSSQGRQRKRLGPLEAHAWLETHEMKVVIADSKTIEILDLFDGHDSRRRYVSFQKAGNFEADVVIRDLFWTTPGQWYSQTFVSPPERFRLVHRSERIEIYRADLPPSSR